jgi:hypothetical protein
VLEELGALSAQDASAVLDRFAETNLASVKQPGNFLTGIIRRVAAEGSAGACPRYGGSQLACADASALQISRGALTCCLGLSKTA